MNTVFLQLDAKDTDRIPAALLRRALIDVGMWGEFDERDPASDHGAAWSLVRKMTGRVGRGVVLSMVVSDALNGYGRAEDWVAFYQQFEESCTRCESDPNHSGRHRWHREWVRKFSSNDTTVECALSRLALRYAIEVKRADDE